MKNTTGKLQNNLEQKKMDPPLKFKAIASSFFFGFVVVCSPSAAAEKRDKATLMFGLMLLQVTVKLLCACTANTQLCLIQNRDDSCFVKSSSFDSELARLGSEVKLQL